MPSKTPTPRRRAIGIVRVSSVNGREGPGFASPDEQLERIVAACERDGLTLLDTKRELDVSGGTPLAKRKGLREAIEAVEAGQADVIVAAYFDRLVRSIVVQAELVGRVEAAGGRVLAVDIGQITDASGSSSEWLSGMVLGLMAEYTRRTAKERTAASQVRAVARGVAPFPWAPAGYLRGPDGVLVPDPATAPAVLAAFHLRIAGKSLAAIRAALAEAGVVRSQHSVSRLLESRVVLGELHFGKLVNPTAHEAIVPLDVWTAAQRVKAQPGRRAKSERLLARLAILHCATCGSRLTVGTSNGGQYPVYRCAPTGICSRRVSIAAPLVEGVVVDAVKAALADVEGRAAVEDHATAAVAELERAQRDLDGVLSAFAGFMNEPAAVARLAELRQTRDDAQAGVDRLGSGPTRIIGIGDWDRLSVDGRRATIRRMVKRVTVAPGRGADRASVELFGQ